MQRIARRLILAGALAGSIIGMQPAFAGLGGDAASITADAADLHGSVNSTPLPQYDIREIANDNGMRVREFLARGGIVFAVAWSGPVMPDLRSLLGASFAAYAKEIAAPAARGMRRSVHLVSSALVIDFGGHMRAYSGRAYLPASIPAGISPAALR